MRGMGRFWGLFSALFVGQLTLSVNSQGNPQYAALGAIRLRRRTLFPRRSQESQIARGYGLGQLKVDLPSHYLKLSGSSQPMRCSTSSNGSWMKRQKLGKRA